MAQKTCTSCKQSKPLAEYTVRRASRDGLATICRECNRLKARRYYAKNREYHVRVIMARKAVQRSLALEAVGTYLLANPCVDCGEGDVRVLDFDHRENCDKSADVMRLAQNGYSVARVMVEIAKCEVRCRNCHAKVTYERLGNDWRTALMQRVADVGGGEAASEEGERDDELRDLPDPG